MSNAMDVANQRLSDYKKAIAKKENEIVELKELIEDLENFIEFGQALVAKGSDQPSTGADVKPRVAVSRPIVKEEAPKAAGTDEWDTPDDTKSGIAKVLSQRVS